MADLNLKFENGKAPALNADNMNKIVNEINRTNAKTKDLQSEIATLVIEKGGSIVQANPEEVPTEKITSIRINEDVFEMASETGIEVTQEVYNAMEAAGEIEADVNYFVKDATTSSDSFAEEISKIKTSLNDFIVKGDLAKITVNLVANGWTDYITLPSGFTFANTYVTSIRIDTNGSIYRYGEGIETAGDRIFAEVISSNKLRVYNNSTKTYPVTIMLMKANL